MFLYLIDWMMTQSGVTLYIYWVGWTYPARNLVTDLDLQKFQLYLDSGWTGLTVGATGQTGRGWQTGYKA